MLKNIENFANSLYYDFDGTVEAVKDYYKGEFDAHKSTFTDGSSFAQGRQGGRGIYFVGSLFSGYGTALKGAKGVKTVQVIGKTSQVVRPIAANAKVMHNGVQVPVYRGYGGSGSMFHVRKNDVDVDPNTGFVRNSPRSGGVSLNVKTNKLGSKNNKPYVLTNIPDTLKIEQRGNDPDHYAILPNDGVDLTFKQYQAELQKISTELAQ